MLVLDLDGEKRGRVAVSPPQEGAEQALERAHRRCRRWGGAAL